MTDLTVVVPIHDPLGVQSHRILRLVASIINQKDSPSEVILASSHEISQEKKITSLIDGQFKIRYLRNSSLGAAENVNFLLDQVCTRYTKIMFQDDFFVSSDSLQKIEYFLSKSRKKWLVSGCNHFNEETRLTTRPLKPRYRKAIRRGINSIGAPSVVAFESDVTPRFNEGMVYMFDCDWYLSMKHNYGKPYTLDEPLVSIGIHSQQATNWAKGSLDKEIEMTKLFHNWNFKARKCTCCKMEPEK